MRYSQSSAAPCRLAIFSTSSVSRGRLASSFIRIKSSAVATGAAKSPKSISSARATICCSNPESPMAMSTLTVVATWRIGSKNAVRTTSSTSANNGSNGPLESRFVRLSAPSRSRTTTTPTSRVKRTSPQRLAAIPPMTANGTRSCWSHAANSDKVLVSSSVTPHLVPFGEEIAQPLANCQLLFPTIQFQFC